IVGKLQNNSVELIENLYRANFSKDESREKFQREALVQLNIMDYYSETAYQMRAITLKQVKIIALQSCETKKLLNGWIKSTKLAAK
ncbi:MAG: four helix bundle protein, partial [Clostridia bacterium]|nr:four helix bundle protein [Clostridia bacterium]